MRKKIAAANWKMNLTLPQANTLLDELLKAETQPGEKALVLFAVPFPYLMLASEKLKGKQGYKVAAQNCSNKKSGAYTGEVSVEMLQSIDVSFCLVGHSERREYFGEDGALLAQKIDVCLESGITPVFCCGEPLEIREEESQDDYVRSQLEDSLFHLSESQLQKLVIAYEPIWAIGTGKTASTEEAQQMHAQIRSVLAGKWGMEVAQNISILYGGSVKASNAAELFACADVDGGLVGGASLVASEFAQIIKALPN